MLLADFAQVSDGKLTIVGGGWSLTGPEPVPFGIAILIRVPWDQANQRHVMRLELLDADGLAVEMETDDGTQPVVFFDDVPFEVGRPAGLKPGTPLDFPVAVNSGPLPLEPGRYEWRLTIDGEADDDWRLPFSVRLEEEDADPVGRGVPRPRVGSKELVRQSPAARFRRCTGRGRSASAPRSTPAAPCGSRVVAAARQRGAARLRRRLAALGDDVHGPGARVAAGLRRPRRGAALEGRDPRADRTSRRGDRADAAPGSSSASAPSGSPPGSGASSRRPRPASCSRRPFAPTRRPSRFTSFATAGTSRPRCSSVAG